MRKKRYKKRIIEKTAVPAKIEVSSIQTKPEGMSVAKAENEAKATAPIIEAPMVASIVEITTKTEVALPEAKKEEMSQTTPTSMVETKIPKTNYPTETKLELYTVTENIIKGNNVTLKGRLSECGSGKGISGYLHSCQRNLGWCESFIFWFRCWNDDS